MVHECFLPIQLERHISNCDGWQIILTQKENTGNDNGRQESIRENIFSNQFINFSV